MWIFTESSAVDDDYNRFERQRLHNTDTGANYECVKSKHDQVSVIMLGGPTYSYDAEARDFWQQLADGIIQIQFASFMQLHHGRCCERFGCRRDFQ